MSKKIKQILAGIFLLAVLTVVSPAQIISMAATGKITFSDPSAAVGQEVSVNMKVSTDDGSLGNADIMVSYDASALTFISGNSVEGGAGTLRAHGGPDASDLKSIVFTMKFRVLRAGTSQIQIASQEVYDTNSQPVTISHEGTSTITAASDGSTDGLLLSLSLTPGTLTPEFSPSVDNYSAHVGMDVQKVDVQALAGEGSSVSVEGSDGLQMGENTITIRVTAPDGVTVKNYTVSVTKSEGGESAAVQPEEMVQGISLEAPAKAITILAPEEGIVLPEGFSATTIDIDGYKAPGFIWASESNHQYCVFYAMNAAGEKNFYRYDLTEKTIQRYFQDPALDTGVSREEYVKLAEDYNSLLQDYKMRMYVIIAVAAVAAVLLILVIILLISRNSASRRAGSTERENNAEDNRKKRRTLNEEEQYLRDQEVSEQEKFRSRVKVMPREDAGYRREEEIELMDLEEDFQEEEPADEVDYPRSSSRTAQTSAKSQTKRTEEDEDFEIFDLD